MFIDIKESPESFIKRAKEIIIENGGTLTGTTTNGEFTVRSVTGEYTQVSDSKYAIEIITKPLLLSLYRIERTIRGYFENGH